MFGKTCALVLTLGGLSASALGAPVFDVVWSTGDTSPWPDPLNVPYMFRQVVVGENGVVAAQVESDNGTQILYNTAPGLANTTVVVSYGDAVWNDNSGAYFDFLYSFAISSNTPDGPALTFIAENDSGVAGVYRYVHSTAGQQTILEEDGSVSLTYRPTLSDDNFTFYANAAGTLSIPTLTSGNTTLVRYTGALENQVISGTSVTGSGAVISGIGENGAVDRRYTKSIVLNNDDVVFVADRTPEDGTGSSAAVFQASAAGGSVTQRLPGVFVSSDTVSYTTQYLIGANTSDALIVGRQAGGPIDFSTPGSVILAHDDGATITYQSLAALDYFNNPVFGELTDNGYAALVTHSNVGNQQAIFASATDPLAVRTITANVDMIDGRVISIIGGTKNSAEQGAMVNQSGTVVLNAVLANPSNGDDTLDAVLLWNPLTDDLSVILKEGDLVEIDGDFVAVAAIQAFGYWGDLWDTTKDALAEDGTLAIGIDYYTDESHTQIAEALLITNTAVPEPASISLLGIVAGGLLARRRRTA